MGAGHRHPGQRIADRHRRLVRQGGIGTVLVVAVVLPAGPRHRPRLPDVPGLHLRRDRPVADGAHRVGRAGLARPVRPGGGGRRSWPPTSARSVPLVRAAAGRRRRRPRWSRCSSGSPPCGSAGLYLAVSTLGFALFMQTTVLATSCWTVPARAPPGVHRAARPPVDAAGRTDACSASRWPTERTFAWFSLGVLVLSVLMVMVWRDRGMARRLVAVRDNETAAAAAGVPIVRTKILAFALSGFMAGYAGVCLAFADQRISVNTFDPTVSILVISMVVIGGLGLDPRCGARRALPGRAAGHLRHHARRSSSSPAASGCWPSSSTCPAAWPRC